MSRTRSKPHSSSCPSSWSPTGRSAVTFVEVHCRGRNRPLSLQLNASALVLWHLEPNYALKRTVGRKFPAQSCVAARTTGLLSVRQVTSYDFYQEASGRGA
jgi:hypothetical protein